MLVEKRKLSWTLDRTEFELVEEPLGRSLMNQGIPPCPEVRFLHQQMTGFCSSVLIAPHLLLTAGHCVMNQKSCEETVFVFDNGTLSATDSGRTRFSAEQSVGCKRIVVRSFEGSWPDTAVADFAVIELDRRVEDREVIPLAGPTPRKPGEAVSLISYPRGLPAKVSPGQVLEIVPGYIGVSVDAFRGSSGGPILNDRWEIVGVIASSDFGGYFHRNRVGYENGCLAPKTVDGSKAHEFATGIEPVLQALNPVILGFESAPR
jgi:hypothetical protein